MSLFHYTHLSTSCGGSLCYISRALSHFSNFTASLFELPSDSISLQRQNSVISLRNSSLLPSQRLPSQCHLVILHGKDPLTTLLVTSKHASLLNAGPTLLLSALGANLSNTGARSLVRAMYKSCITCKRASAITEKQIMSQLLPQRVTASSPFAKTGMDFAGPFTLKKGHTRKPVLIKAYVCVFVCFVTKAAHLEVVYWKQPLLPARASEQGNVIGLVSV